MKLIIDIPEEQYNTIKSDLYNTFSAEMKMWGLEAIRNGTPLSNTGHWIKTTKAVMGDGYMWYCDKCEHQVYQDSSKSYPSEKYCPNCGAKMIESKESEE